MPYLSMTEQLRRQRKRLAQQNPDTKRQQSKMCLSVNSGHGQLTAYAPLKV